MSVASVDLVLDKNLYDWVESEAREFGIPAENFIRILIRQEMRRVQALEAIRNHDLDVTLEEVNR